MASEVKLEMLGDKAVVVYKIITQLFHRRSPSTTNLSLLTI